MADHSHDESRAVDIATAATTLCTSQKFVRQRIKSGDLPAYRLPGSRLIRIDVADLKAFKESLNPESTDTDAYVQKILAAAPPLSQEQRAKLAELLAPIRRGERGDLSA